MTFHFQGMKSFEIIRGVSGLETNEEHRGVQPLVMVTARAAGPAFKKLLPRESLPAASLCRRVVALT